MRTKVRPDEWQPSPGIALEETAEKVIRSGGNTCVVAGPGAGKTELLAQRAMFLLSTGACPYPRRILAISFKVDAAATLRHRVATRCGDELAIRFDSLTFDAFAKRIVDRFRAALPEHCRPEANYQVIFPRKEDWDQFLHECKPPPDLGSEYDLLGLHPGRLNHKHGDPQGLLRDTLKKPCTLEQWAIRAWWERQLKAHPPKLSFPMIRALANYILYRNPKIAKALQLTYSHVFLDEFQDTTPTQLELIVNGFCGSEVSTTAVGDTKQRIMGFAGAIPDIFGLFQDKFDASLECLRMNHRSNARIVQLINRLSFEIDEDAVLTECARSDELAPPNAVQVWGFPDQYQEAKAVAGFIRDQIDWHSRSPADFVILTRQKAEDLQGRLEEAFTQQGLRLRNAARYFGPLQLQDLLEDEVFQLLVSIIKLAIGYRYGVPYQKCQETISQALGADLTSDRGVLEVNKRVRGLVRSFRHITENQVPVDAESQNLSKTLFGFVDKESFCSSVPKYEDRHFLDRVLESFDAFFEVSKKGLTSWGDVVGELEGCNQVDLMTIHKSKGLEYHTVFFVDLHDQSLWNYRKNPTEETNNFFVALSRAEERVVFTYADDSGSRDQIQELYRILEDDGAEMKRPCD
ncbi:ATP-dependent helicase [Halorhodospira sp. 9621]|uniref:UvrD-helicase domain-containing protein n=1 Tax=Halorhodospira sp. 9621 TaxID=2899135 RepID=UPI001EE81472|nr:ATP-dependent helicase [Halorhodospira sp. 9621]MCG5534018.1 ATP-dependent helicase [Halorhodospira sp. 9621]